MYRNKLKAYAPQARRDFIKAVTDRAAYYGLTEKKIEPITEQGDVAIIAGKAFPRAVAAKRKRLEERIRRQGFEQVMEAMAYTWFNRLVAIRFMELQGYLDHGYRVLSHPEGSATPEIVEHAEHVDLPGLDRDKVIELKLEGTRESELYRMLLIAQCNALNRAMPFLFEWVGNETELLLPENLLHSDSLIRKLVNEIPKEEWQEVEIIGWLYQFYISEKKDQVIGKVVKSEDIPAATQLFTPNWIVKYMVQNTLGRQWVATYPNSPLKQQMEFYIEPAEQTLEVQEQLKAITPASLNPEQLTLLDPACGSGHILVEAYDLLKAIYQERGYRAKDIPRLILEKNLYGLEIDDRAAQLAAFALMMKARADDRLIFKNGTQPHVLAFQESRGLDAEEITETLNSPILKTELPPRELLFEEMEDARTPLFSRKNLSVKGDISQADVAHLIDLFEHGKTFGSLIGIPEALARKLPEVAERLMDVLTHGEMFGRAAAGSLRPIVEQARLLARKYDSVVTNPPYLGSSNMPTRLKQHVRNEFPEASGDTFAAFVVQCLRLAADNRTVGLVTPFVWMFLSTYEDFRQSLLSFSILDSLVQLEYNAFEPACVPVCTFTLSSSVFDQYVGTYVRLTDFKGAENQAPRLLEAVQNRSCSWRHSVAASSLKAIPGTPIAYWASEKVLRVFESSTLLGNIAEPKQGLATGDNNRFLRLWYEVDRRRVLFDCPTRQAAKESGRRWFPCNKGGPYRKWYGNNQFLVNWENDGEAIGNFTNDRGKLRSRPQNVAYYFRKGITWSTLSSSAASFRLSPVGHIFETKGSTCFVKHEEWYFYVFGLLNSCVVNYFLGMFSPTLDFHEGPLSKLPVLLGDAAVIKEVTDIVREAVEMAKDDWNSQEKSWDFKRHCFLNAECCGETCEDSFQNWSGVSSARIARLKELEETNNGVFLSLYGLDKDLSNHVLEDDVVLCRPTREDTLKSLISYAIGCIMGRYSLDRPGLIYAASGNEDFDRTQYMTLPVDEDGIVPVTDTPWFDDDAANRIIQFINLPWPRTNLEKNLIFIADSLGRNRGESPRDTIRRYLAQSFYKDHLKTYKGPKHPPRPIYWLFSSGKQRTFQCLVYLHRYNEGTLSRMRTEYVIPLQGKINARIDQLKDDITASTSSAHRKKLEKERDKLIKQQVELRAFDEKLRHYADQRISLDLDDGVRVNYGKFGDLLAEVKAVTGKSPE